MQKVRTIMRPATEGTHFTLAEAKQALRELYRERDEKKKTSAQRKRTAKAE